MAARFPFLLPAVIGLALAAGLPAAAFARAVPDSIRFGPVETRRCLRCHGMPNFAASDRPGSVRDLHVDGPSFAASAHGRLDCRSCHADVDRYPHVFPAGGRPAVSCGDDCHALDRRGRPYRHGTEARDFAASVHARGEAARNPDSPRCTTCHGGSAHAIAPAAARKAPLARMAACAGCHDDRAMMRRSKVDPLAVASYRRSFHWKAVHFGASGTAVCQDCHGVHRVLAPKDTASGVAAANLPRTCGQDKCHPGARMNFALSGANHLTLRIERSPVLRFEERFFLLLTGGTMLALVGGIVLDVQRRLGWLAIAAGLGRALRAGARRAAVLGLGALRVGRRVLAE